MAEEHVTAVFGPPHVREALEDARRRLRLVEDHVLNLRQELRRHDPSLPDIYDGAGWHEWEQTSNQDTRDES